MFGRLSDIHGRKRILSLALVALFITSALSAVARTKLQFLILRCLVGVAMGITFPVALIFSAEIVKNKYREVGPMLIVFVCNTCIFLVSVSAYFLLNRIGWRWFVFINTLPLILCFVFLMLVPESPRYLIVSGKHKQAHQAVAKMAQWNGKVLPDNLTLAVHEDQDLGSLKDIFSLNYRKETVLLSMIYFGNLLIIFGSVVFVPLALYSGFCGGKGEPPKHECTKIEQSSLLSLSYVTAGAVFATGVGYISAMKLGRNISLKMFAVGGLLVTLALYKCINDVVTNVLLFLVKFFFTCNNMVSLIIVPELYPTSIRNTAMGFINSCGKFGGALGAGLVYVLYYLSPFLVVSLFVFAALVVLVSSCLWTKETKGAVIQDTFE